MGLGALWDPNLHPRGWHGRFIKKFTLSPWLKSALEKFNPRQFQSNAQAALFAGNMGHRSPAGAFSALDARRIRVDLDEAFDHLRNNDLDPTTQQFVHTMDSHMMPAPPGGLILARTFTPDALGLRQDQLNEDNPNGIISLMGNTIQDKAYGVHHLGTSDNHGPGKITMTTAVPEGTKVAYSGQGPNDRGVFMDRNQKLLITRVDPDGRGGWYMMAVAEPPGSTSGNPVSAVEGRKGAGLTEVQRDARIRGLPLPPPESVGGKGSTAKPVAEPPSPATPQYNVPNPMSSVEPGPGRAETPEQAAAHQARRAGYQQARAAEDAAGGVPQGAVPPEPAPAPAQAAPAPPTEPQPVTPQPAPVAPGVGTRTEPVHGPIGGANTEGKSASEIAATPPAVNTPTPAAPTPSQANPSSIREAFHDSGIGYPTSGPQRAQVTKVLTGIGSGREHPRDGLMKLESDIDHNKALLDQADPNTQQAKDLRANISQQEKTADLISQHFNLPRKGEKAPEATPEPTPEAPKAEEPKAPAVRKVRDAGKENQERKDAEALGVATRDEKGKQRPLSQVRKEVAEKKTAKDLEVLTRGGHRETPTSEEKPKGSPLSGSQADRNAAAAARRAETGEQKPTVNAANIKAGDKILVKKNEAGEWERTTRKTGATPITVTGKRAGPGGHIIEGTGPDGEKIETKPHSGRLAFQRHIERAPRAGSVASKTTLSPKERTDVTGLTPAEQSLYHRFRADGQSHDDALRSAQEAFHEQELSKNPDVVKKATKAVARKATKAAPAPKEASELQKRADEAGLPTTVTALRQAAREKKIRGFSTMNKDQLQRALLGEEVSTGKIGLVSPEKLAPHIEAAKSRNEAQALLKDHTISDLRKLVPEDVTKGLKTKGKIEDAVLKHLRGEETTGLKPEIPTESLAKEIEQSKIHIPEGDDFAKVRSIVDGIGDDNNASELRKGRDELEKVAQESKDPHLSRVAQRTADALGMRAQRISGVEEEPTPVKRAVKSSPVPGHEDLGGTKNDLLQIAEKEGVNAKPSWTKGQIQKAIKDHREGTPPAPTKAEVRKAAKAAAVPKGELNLGENRGLKGNLEGRGSKVDNLGPSQSAEERAGQLGPNPTPIEKIEALGRAKAARTGQPLPPGQGALGHTEVGKRLVPEGSVKGERAQVPITSEARQIGFDQAYKDRLRTVAKNVSPSATRSMAEIQNDVSTGKISPEEGIRRLESEIFINNDEVQDINRTIRSGQAEGAELDKLRQQRDQLLRDNAAAAGISQFMHQHFGKERVTPAEVKEQIEKDTGLNLGQRLKRMPGDELREAIRTNPETAHLGEIKGETGEEVFDNALKKIISNELEKRAAKKAAPAKVAKAAPEAAPAKASPFAEFESGGGKHLDVASTVEGAGGRELFNYKGGNYADDVQKKLNEGKTPGQVAKEFHDIADGNKVMDHLLLGPGPINAHGPEGEKLYADRAVQLAEADRKSAALRQLADAVGKLRRPVARKAAAAKAVEDITEARKATKEPAAKKALKQAEASVKQSSDEAEALKARIIKRHNDAWEAATSKQAAEAAAAEMRKDLTLGEIRDWAGEKGIRGRSKEDILRKAVDQRFADIEELPKPNRVEATNNRMARASKVRNVARTISELEGINANGPSDEARIARARSAGESAGLEPDLVDRLVRGSGDQSELDRIAAEHNLVRNTEGPGAAVPFDPNTMQEIEGNPRKGTPVRIISPGYEGTTDGRAFQAAHARVQRDPSAGDEILRRTTPEQRQAVGERLLRNRPKAAKVAPAATSAVATAAKPSTEEIHNKLSSFDNPPTMEEARAMVKDLTKPELVDLARKASIPGANAKSKETLRGEIIAANPGQRIGSIVTRGFTGERPGQSTPGAEKFLPNSAPVKRSYVKIGPGIIDRFGRQDGDEKVQLPNGGADQGVIHMDSQIGELWEDLIADDRVQNSTLNKVTDIGHRLGSGRIDVPTAAKEIAALKSGNEAVDNHIERVAKKLTVSPANVNVPNNTPQEVKDWLQKMSEIPSFRTPRPGEDKSPFEEATEAIREISTAPRSVGRKDAERKLENIANNIHESQDGIYQARRDTDKIFFPSNQSAEVRKWFRSEGVPETAAAPETPAAPAKAAKAVAKKATSKPSPLRPHMIDTGEPLHPVDRVGLNVQNQRWGGYAIWDAKDNKVEGDFTSRAAAEKRLTELANGATVHKYEERKPTAKEAREAERLGKAQAALLGGTPSEPAKATFAKAAPAKKTAPAKVTQAELRNPVPKAGTAAPSAPAAVQARGLTPGEGVPTGNFLALKNKLGANQGDLNALDRAARVPSNYAKVPELYAKVQADLQRLGIGPNDEPRKSLIAWFEKHFG